MILLTCVESRQHIFRQERKEKNEGFNLEVFRGWITSRPHNESMTALFVHTRKLTVGNGVQADVL